MAALGTAGRALRDQYVLGSTEIVKQRRRHHVLFRSDHRVAAVGSVAHLGVPEPVLNIVQPALQVIVEAGYDRSIPFGDPTPAELIPSIDPATFTLEFANGVVQGANNAFELFGAQLPDSPQSRALFTATETWSETTIGVPYDQVVTELNTNFNRSPLFQLLGGTNWSGRRNYARGDRAASSS